MAWLCQTLLHTQSTYGVIHFLKFPACALLLPGSSRESTTLSHCQPRSSVTGPRAEAGPARPGTETWVLGKGTCSREWECYHNWPVSP